MNIIDSENIGLLVTDMEEEAVPIPEQIDTWLPPTKPSDEVINWAKYLGSGRLNPGPSARQPHLSL
jgi:hypothetical protein